MSVSDFAVHTAGFFYEANRHPRLATSPCRRPRRNHDAPVDPTNDTERRRTVPTGQLELAGEVLEQVENANLRKHRTQDQSLNARHRTGILRFCEPLVEPGTQRVLDLRL